MSKHTPPIIYLDHAAATPVAPEVLRAMRPYFADNFYNPSATYRPALAVRQAVEAARSKVAHWLGARSSEIVFTAGGTEANNLAIHGVMRQYPQGNIVVSAIEHESVLEPAGEYDCRLVGVKPDGWLDLDDLRQKIDQNTVLVSIMYANNEIGTVQPLREVAKIIAEKRAQRVVSSDTLSAAGTGSRGSGSTRADDQLPLFFHSDACQAANYLDLHAARLGVDLLTINGGKLYGPKQSGALYVRAGLSLRPLITGGGQERGLRAGTENVAAAIGLATALDLAQTDRHHEAARLRGLQADFLQLITQQLPGAAINGSLKYRLPNNVHLTLPGQDNERLLIQLDEAGILAAAGSACSASDDEPSHVLRALGVSQADARASLRLTLGRGTTLAELERTVEQLASYVSTTHTS